MHFICGKERARIEKKNQPGTESVESVGIFNLNVTRDVDLDLDCTSGPSANPPSPPPYDDDKLYPDLRAEEEDP